jgi:hypothetical protein
MPIYGSIVRVLTIASIAMGLYILPSNIARAMEKRLIGGYLLSSIGKLCSPSEIFVAQIVSASLADCRLKDSYLPTCDPKGELMFRLRVEETLAANERELAERRVKLVRPSESIDVVTKLFNSRPTDPDGRFPPEDEYGILRVDPPTGEPLSDQEISRLFIGQRFIFGIRPNPFDKTTPPSATVWTMRTRQWVEENLQTCSRFVRY